MQVRFDFEKREETGESDCEKIWAVNSRVIVFAVTLIRWLIWSTNTYVYIVFV